MICCFDCDLVDSGLPRVFCARWLILISQLSAFVLGQCVCVHRSGNLNQPETNMSVAFAPHRQRAKGDITPAGIQKVTLFINSSSRTTIGNGDLRLQLR